MTKWFWYLRKPNEIFVDIDGKDAETHARQLHRSRRRIHGVIGSGLLNIESVWLFPSSQELHHHIIITTGISVVNACEACTWALYFGSDVFRACNNLARWMDDKIPIGSEDLLISAYPLNFKKNFERKFDATCTCPSKHDQKIMESCPVATRLRGLRRAHSYFGKPANIEPWDKIGRVYP